MGYGRAEPLWEHGACRAAAVVAVIDGDEGEADFAAIGLRLGEGVVRAIGDGGDVDFVP